MKIGLVDIDSKIPNLALMKLSAWHKEKGDEVVLSSPLFANQHDKVFASKIFTYTEDPILPNQTIRGGAGYDTISILDDGIEHIMPDYDLYPLMNYSLGFTTRGCIRRCEFCIVPEKEGGICFNTDIYEFWNLQHRDIVLLDNNILALKNHFEKISEQLLKKNLRVDFNQGLDIRLLTSTHVEILKQLKPMKQWRFAFDGLRYENAFRKGAELLLQNKIPKHLICVYVLAGFDESLEDTLKRINIIYKEYGFDPFLMLYQDFGSEECLNPTFRQLRTDMNTPAWKKWRNFARWVNHKAIFKSVKWENYSG